MISRATEVEKSERLKLIAFQRVQGISHEAIASLLKIQVATLTRVMNTDEYRAVYREIIADRIATAASEWRAQVTELRELAIKALKNRLEANDVNAIKIVMATLGIDKSETPQSAALTVVLPDYRPKAEMEVLNGTVTNSEDDQSEVE